MTDKHQKVSVVVPAFNEGPNIGPLVAAVAEMWRQSGLRGEMILVDDGSLDDTLQKARDLAREHDFLRVLSHRPNRGLTFALETGFKAAQGDVIVFYPADLQYDPLEIPRLVNRLGEGFDLVAGRKRGHYGKRFVSGAYNALSRRLFGVGVHDLNSVKAFRREIVEVLDYRRDFHRYMVVMAARAGYRIGEVDVTLHPRAAGTSKFSGPGRVLVGMLDMLAVWFQYTFLRKPLLLFGSAGLVCFAAGLLVGLVALYMRYVLDAGFRPLLSLVSLLVITGVTLFGLGFLGEAIYDIRRKVSRIEDELRDLRRSDDD